MIADRRRYDVHRVTVTSKYRVWPADWTETRWLWRWCLGRAIACLSTRPVANLWRLTLWGFDCCAAYFAENYWMTTGDAPWSSCCDVCIVHARCTDTCVISDHVAVITSSTDIVLYYGNVAHTGNDVIDNSAIWKQLTLLSVVAMNWDYNSVHLTGVRLRSRLEEHFLPRIPATRLDSCL